MNIEQLAREAGFTENMGRITARHSSGAWVAIDDRLERFAALVRNEALEEARLKAKQISDKYAFGYYGSEVDACDEIEAAIRSMKEVKT